MPSPLQYCLSLLAAGVMAAPLAPALAGHHEGDDHDHHHEHGEDGHHEEHSHAEHPTAEPADDGFANQAERASYAIGIDIGRNFRNFGVEISPEIMAEAIAASYADEELRMTEQQAVAAVQRFQQELQQKQLAALIEQQQEAITANAAEAETFFADNSKKEGVVVTESGLQYLVTELGQGAKAGPQDQVTVHYKGQLLDGTVFDSSYDRGEPATFPVAGVIPGFGEGLQLMPVGSKGTLYIPSDIAYGVNPPPGSPITPGAALIFDVEVIAVPTAKTTPQPLGD